MAQSARSIPIGRTLIGDVESWRGIANRFSMLAGCKKAVADFSDRWRLSLLGAYSCQKFLSRIKTAVVGE
jgi:hypothetical protein